MMSEIVTILAPTRDQAFAILNANYENYTVRIASFHDYFNFTSTPPINSSIDDKQPTGRLNEFLGYHPSDGDPVFTLVAITG